MKADASFPPRAATETQMQVAMVVIALVALMLAITIGRADRRVGRRDAIAPFRLPFPDGSSPSGGASLPLPERQSRGKPVLLTWVNACAGVRSIHAPGNLWAPKL
jgi:hypothetical protein